MRAFEPCVGGQAHREVGVELTWCCLVRRAPGNACCVWCGHEQCCHMSQLSGLKIGCHHIKCQGSPCV